MDMSELTAKVVEQGAKNAAVVPVGDIIFDPRYRELCASNACGNYGRCWMCPPDVGEVDQLIDEAKAFDWALVYQTVRPLEDSYDFEGMMEAGQLHNQLAQQLSAMAAELLAPGFLHLGAGGCRYCEVCAKKTGEPCRFPDKATASLEAYGISVSELAALGGMPYIHGVNTVTYFGAILFTANEQTPEHKPF